MNTPKKEDIIKELDDSGRALIQATTEVFSPFVKIFSLVSRRMYLEHELRKVTPRPAPTIVEEKKDDKEVVNQEGS